MSEPFSAYADFYDILYREKDYRGESAYVASLIKQVVKKTPPEISVLDLACGTGRHAVELADIGFEIEGSDRSLEMIRHAEASAGARSKNIKFHTLSFQEIDRVAKQYDVVISMFAAINYLTTLSDVSLTLKNIAGILKPGGIFLFDYWNAHAVVRDYSPVKVLRKKDENKEITRISETSIDIAEQIATVKFTCSMHEGDTRKYQFEELHTIRFYYLRQMDELLRLHRFEPIYVSPFMKVNAKVDPYDWNISVIARVAA